MYDIIFIGGGLNYAGAVIAAKKGLKVALIEKNMEHIGGTCLNNGCIPSKHLLHLAKTLINLKNPAFSEAKININLEIALHEIDEILKKSHKSIKIQCINAGVELIEGIGYIIDKNIVEVNEKKLESKYIIIGTGAYPNIPDGIEYNKKSIITSDEALNLKEFPSSIAIYGSGAIGLEMASFFAANSIDTTLIYKHSQISNKIHPMIVKNIENMLKNLGVKLMPNTTILQANGNENKVKITTKDEEYEFDKLLVATGRKPNIEAIKIDSIKIEKGIITDDFFTTTTPNIYAIGDCNAKLMLAHAARAQVLNVVNTILGDKSKLNLCNIPRFIYTLPMQYASIGLVKKDNPQKESIFPLSSLAISHLVGGKDGQMIIYADEEDFVIGAEILSPYAEEIISALSVSLSTEADVKTMLDSVFAHPTYSEAIDRALRRLK